MFARRSILNSNIYNHLLLISNKYSLKHSRKTLGGGGAGKKESKVLVTKKALVSVKKGAVL